jgi:hypothetical protein
MRFKLVYAVVGLLLVLLAAGGGQGRAGDGPLTSRGFGIASAQRKVGQVIETSFPVTNRRRMPATIERIRLLSDPGLRLVGIRSIPLATVQKARKDGTRWGIPGILDGFPSPQLPYKGEPTGAGSSIPHGGTVFLVGLAATRPGFHATREILVDYHVGVQRFHAAYWLQIYLCTPGTCPS